MGLWSPPPTAPAWGIGVSGRQLIVGLWEMVEGQPKTLFSYHDQARELVEQGRVAREDAESLLGRPSST